jgi:phosphoribosylglycinamide formyltransferase 1
MEAIIKAINSGQVAAELKVVISNNPEAAGLKKAENYDIKTAVVNPKEFLSKSDYEQKVVSHLKEAGVELVVLAGYMRIVGKDILDAFPKKIINIHPSLLPAFKGLDAQKQAFDSGVEVSGCTVHYVDETLDGGLIISQAVVAVEPEDTAESLSRKILVKEHQLLPAAINLFAQGKL